MKASHKLLFIILIVASFLRLYKLSYVPVSMFGDELDVGYHAFSILETGKDYNGNSWPLHFQSLAEYRTPLYLYSAVPTVAIYGISPLGVRLPAAIYGILGVWGIFLLSNQLLKKQFGNWNLDFGLLPALVLAFSPWHIQYSRGGFEVTMFLTFLLFGFYFFFESLNQKGKHLWISVILLCLTPLIYSTAKLFTLLLLIFLVLFYIKQIIQIKKVYLVYAIIAGLLVGGVTSYATLFSGGAQRFSYIGIFSDPTIEPEVGFNRSLDSSVRGDKGIGINPTLMDKIFHNKIVFWIDVVSRNYFQSLSSDFLFFSGDPNPRHSIDGMGEFYRVDMALLILGLVFFFTSKVEPKVKYLIFFWIIAGIFPASITRDGGNHATRLIIILPPLVVLISYGLYKILTLENIITRSLLSIFYLLLFLLSFGFYSHDYLVHNPWQSERWWHSGWKEAISEVKKIDSNYERVFISMKGEPAWIFFAAHYQYPPYIWQKEFPVGNDEFVEGFGFVSHTGKYYFGSPQDVNGAIYGLRDYIEKSDLYLANASEVGENLILDPSKSPVGIRLLKAIPFPSGEPAFYLFEGI